MLNPIKDLIDEIDISGYFAFIFIWKEIKDFFRVAMMIVRLMTHLTTRT